MKGLKKIVQLAAIFVIACTPLFTTAQQKEKKRNHEFYFSWGYNKEWYTHSSLHISQPSLGNDFVFENIKGHDHPGWDGQLFTKAISIPQYNYRVGYFINEKKGLAVEINFDHTKFIFHVWYNRSNTSFGKRIDFYRFFFVADKMPAFHDIE